VLHTLKKQGDNVVAHLKAVLDRLADDIYARPLAAALPKGSHLRLKGYWPTSWELHRSAHRILQPGADHGRMIRVPGLERQTIC
jgi:hypothetical protein